MAAAAAAAVVVAAEGAQLDQMMVRAAEILVSLRSKKLRAWPKWVPKPEGEEESESFPGTAPLEAPMRWARRRPRSGGRRGSCVPWRKALRELDLAGSHGEERDAASAPAPAAGSGSPSTSSASRAAPTTQTRPSRADGKAPEKALAAATAAASAKEPMTASSPDTPLDYGAGGSRASSSADDAVRPPAKRKGPGACGSGGEDDEGCSSPAKRPREAADEVMKPIPTEQSMQIETTASSTKGFAFDLNFPPALDDDDA